MENYSYTASYPESGDSSPRSREVDLENSAPWEDQTAINGGNGSGNSYKVKLMCSYGGKIHPRPHDHQLAYVGGETKILAVDRSVKFAAMVAKLTALFDADLCFKYQLPGEDLDALISVTNDDDLEHMMHEYDRLNRASPRPARLRLFLFPVSGQSPALTPVHSFGSTEGRSERERFVDALNTGHVQSSTAPAAASPHGNIELLFSSDKGMPPQPGVAVQKNRDHPVADPPIHHEPKVAVIDDREIEADRIQKHIQDLQRLQIAEDQQQALYRRQNEDNLGYTGDYYVQKMAEKIAPATLPGTLPSPVPGYQISGGFTASTISPDQQPVYMIPAHASMYHAPMARPVTAPVSHGQGYYAVQRMPTEVYRDQPVYNVMSPAQPVATQQTTMPPPQQQLLPQNVATYSEGIRMVQSQVTDAGYAQVAFDNGVGRQVYYTAQGAVMAAAPQQQPPQQTLQPTTQQYAMATLNHDGGGKVVPANMKDFI